MSEIKLKPCPFCGAIPIVRELPSDDRMLPEKTRREFPWVVLCPNSGGCFMTVATMQSLTREDAIAAWNTRTPDCSNLERVHRMCVEALRAVVMGNDIAYDRKSSIDSWHDSRIRREAGAALDEAGKLDQPKERI